MADDDFHVSVEIANGRILLHLIAGKLIIGGANLSYEMAYELAESLIAAADELMEKKKGFN